MKHPVVIYGPHRAWPFRHRSSSWVFHNLGDFLSPQQQGFALDMLLSTSFVKCHSGFNDFAKPQKLSVCLSIILFPRNFDLAQSFVHLLLRSCKWFILLFLLTLFIFAHHEHFMELFYWFIIQIHFQVLQLIIMSVKIFSGYSLSLLQILFAKKLCYYIQCRIRQSHLDSHCEQCILMWLT